MAGIDKLIINSAYREPEHHWKYDMNGQTFVQEPGRRPAGYFIAGQGTNQYNDIGKFIELDLVNKIRPRVKAWRENGYPGVTGVTKRPKSCLNIGMTKMPASTSSSSVSWTQWKR